MTSFDLVERLLMMERRKAPSAMAALLNEAAAEIELLRQTVREWVPEIALGEIERLRAASDAMFASLKANAEEITQLRAKLAEYEERLPDDMT